MDWYVLGIEPTKDKNAITAAYRQKLRQTNPEDKPEAFKALRTAYEQALAYADQENTAPARDESPIGLWIEAIGNLYDDYARRIDPKNWEALMASDVCVALAVLAGKVLTIEQRSGITLHTKLVVIFSTVGSHKVLLGKLTGGHSQHTCMNTYNHHTTGINLSNLCNP